MKKKTIIGGVSHFYYICSRFCKCLWKETIDYNSWQTLTWLKGAPVVLMANIVWLLRSQVALLSHESCIQYLTIGVRVRTACSSGLNRLNWLITHLPLPSSQKFPSKVSHGRNRLKGLCSFVLYSRTFQDY